MSLQVWLPLNGNLNNYGLSGLKFSTLSTNTDVNSDGKIGQCYENDSLSAGGLISDNTVELGQNQSMFCWFKFTSLSSNSSNLGGGIMSQHRYPSNQGMGITIKYVSSTTGYLSVNTGNGSSRTFNTYCGTTLLQANTWYHGGYTYDGSNIRIYVNGVLEKTQAYTGMLVPADYLTVFCWSMSSSSGNTVLGSYKLQGSINDVRIYNHCLSQQEIKEISKGLVLHYKLTEKSCGGTSVNLVANGWGGLDNWTTPENVSTEEIPPDVTPVPTHSYKNNISKQFILIKNPKHTYTISAYVKIYGSNTLSYLALIPYDVDKKQINWFNCSAGFKTDSLTTLRTDLNPGDTIIYLDTNTDMATWTNTSRYYGHVAIFGYSDSTGYVYDDLLYTQRVYRYRGTGSTFDANENINVTNKTITLKAAYNGQTIPAGTHICLTCEGATYYYPKTISASLSADWVLLTQSFIPASIPYTQAAKYFKVRAMSNNWTAAITLVDTNDNNIIYDDSGYGNNGTITGNLSAINDSPRYNHSIEFLKGSKAEKSLRVDKYNWTIAFWMNCDWTDTSVSSAQMIRWNSSGYIFIRKQTTTRLLIIYYYYWNSSNESKSIYAYIMSASNVPTSREWIHCAVTFDGTTIRTYFNGTYKNSSTLPDGATLRNESANGTFSVHYTSSEIPDMYSDVRVYATTLSNDDIKELYNSRANIDNTGNLSCYEFSELEGSKNIFNDIQKSVSLKEFSGKLAKAANQANCVVSFIDEGIRIYRDPNITYNSSDSSTKTMWGGIKFVNIDNVFNLTKNHTYIIQFDIKGKTSCAFTYLIWTNNAGWTTTTSGLNPAPTGVIVQNPIVANYNNNKWSRLYYKFTISDDVYKVCATGYSTFVSGQTYLSYKEFFIGFSYQNTGELGTNLVINNITMIDVTDGTTLTANVSKEGIFEMTYGYENHYSCFFNKNKDINANQLLEV